MAAVFSSDIKITLNQQSKRLALDGGGYTYNNFKNHNHENLVEEKWKQVTELSISDLTLAENEKTHEAKDYKSKVSHLKPVVRRSFLQFLRLVVLRLQLS